MMSKRKRESDHSLGIITSIVTDLGNRGKATINLLTDQNTPNILLSNDTHQSFSSFRRPWKEEVCKSKLEELPLAMSRKVQVHEQHKKGYPARLIASSVLPVDSTIAVKPVLRYSYFAHVVKGGLQVHHLKRRKQWAINTKEAVAAIAISQTHLFFASKDTVSVVGLEDLYQLPPILQCDHKKVRSRKAVDPGTIVKLAGHKEDVLVLSTNGSKNVLSLWQGDRKISKGHDWSVKGDIDVDGSGFLFVRLDKDGKTKVILTRFPFDGSSSTEQSYTLTRVCETIRLVDVGYAWSLLTESKSHRDDLVLTSTPQRLSCDLQCLWNDRIYSVRGKRIQVSRASKKSEGSPVAIVEGDVLGSLQFLGHGDDVGELMVNDSFMVVQHRNQATEKWFIFTFDDLPGVEVGTEAVSGEYFWQERAVEEEVGWKWHVRREGDLEDKPESG